MNLDKLEASIKNSFTYSQMARINKVKRKIFSIMEGHPDDFETKISGEVGSEISNEKYKAYLFIDDNRNKVLSTYCNCKDFHNNNYYRDAYMCKHLGALILKYIELKREDIKKEIQDGKMYLDLIKLLEDPKQKVDLEIYIYDDFKYNEKRYLVNFKIGTIRKYVIKNLNDFIEAKNNYKLLHFGKDFEYHSLVHTFDDEDEKIIKKIEEAVYIQEKLIGRSLTFNVIKGKNLVLNSSTLRNFLELCIHKRIWFEEKCVDIVKRDIPINFKLRRKDEKLIMSVSKQMPKALTTKMDSFIVDNTIYLPSAKQIELIRTFYNLISGDIKEIAFSNEDSKDVFNILIPKLEEVSKVSIDKSIDIVREELKSEFYLDIKRGKVTLDVKLKYGEEETNVFEEKSSKIIIRDIEKENKILRVIKETGFENIKKSFIFQGNDEKLYLFLTKEYKKLEELGEVFYSNKFKERKLYKIPSINANIKEENGYLNLTFDIENVSKDEYKKIINAIKDRRKFFKLKDDSFLNLEGNEINEFLTMIDNISSGEKDIQNLKLHKNKAVMLEEYLKVDSLKFVKGKELVDEIIDKLKNVNEKDYDIPKNLNAVLREYQVEGFKWFKNLSYLGFGGVLADEMGLGKTIQTIAFLLSEEGKKSLIITPTSLIYNWKNEFERFAPSLKIALVHENKSERFKIISEMNDYDVLLTTYGTLRNDKENYENITFDYCIIDEGQHIKNSVAQSTKAVKDINARVKFALTGTPIENNLLELWSIFDFVMPGYLYNGTIFKKKFIDSENSIKELQKYIKPFMLRRLKKDVIKELPEKIEKRYYVDLTNEQKKIYGVFVKDIKRKIEESSFLENKITIFSYLTKLRQLCLDPSVIIENYEGGSGKIDCAIDIIKENIEEHPKIILFSQFTSVLNNIKKSFEKNDIEYIYLDGNTNAKQRISIVNEFNESKKKLVFLISLKAGGTGLNLTSADIVIHFDPWWNPSIEEQATDRTHRIGQKNVVQVFKLVAEGTIEEKILKLQDEKKSLINDVMNEDYKSGNVLGTLSEEEIKQLLL